MKMTVDEIIRRLRQIQLLDNCDLKIVLQGQSSRLEIESRKANDLVQSILGLARLADAYGLREVVITGGERFNPLVFPVSVLEYYGMDAESLGRIRERAQRHQALMTALPHEIVFLHGQEEPFIYLDAKVKIEKRLNVPLLELLGSPINRVESAISEPKKFWLKRAVDLGTAQEYYYTHHWRNLDWRFKVNIAPLAGTEEAIVIVSDAESWQRPWWEAQLARPLAEQTV